MSHRSRFLTSLSIRFLILAVFAALVPAARADRAARIEQELRATFPSVSIESAATIRVASERAAGRELAGFRADSPRASESRAPLPAEMSLAAPMDNPSEAVSPRGLKAFYPRFYADPVVVERGNQRGVLQPLGARAAEGKVSGGRVVDANVYEAVDAIEVPRSGGRGELLGPGGRKRPLVYAYHRP